MVGYEINPRTQRAQDALLSATRMLASEKPTAEITLTEIAKEAGVSRPTIYKLYDDVDTLVAASATAFIGEILDGAQDSVRGLAGKEYMDALMSAFVEGVYEQREFAHNVMYGTAMPKVYDYVIRLLDSMMAEHLIGRRLNAGGTGVDDRRQAIAAGVVWLLGVWLGSDFEGENKPSKMASRLSNVLYGLSEGQIP
ncbi:MAG: TetR/AcrR family transcriptional regulator [Eggerthellaceae bacterium]|nr:TetR/AcrR family transcriptional regulator [Eggerthellaceae bacterium]